MACSWRDERVDIALEVGRGLRLAGGEALPRGLGRLQTFQHACAQCAVDAPVVPGLQSGFIDRRQPIDLAYLVQAWRWVQRGGDEIQRLPHQPLAQRRCRFVELAHLHVDAAEQLFHMDGWCNFAAGHTSGKTVQHPPVGAAVMSRRASDEFGQHIGKAGGAGFFRLRIGAFQQGQQRLFEALPQVRGLGGAGLHGRRGQPRLYRQVGEIQVGRVDARDAARLLQVAVVRIQFERLRRGAGQQFVQVFGQRAAGCSDGVRVRRLCRQRTVGSACEQVFDRFGQQGCAGDVDDMQRAMRLVHHLRRLPQRIGGGTGIEPGGRQRQRAGAGERDADLFHNPGQRSGIELVRNGGGGRVAAHACLMMSGCARSRRCALVSQKGADAGAEQCGVQGAGCMQRIK